MIHPDLNIPFGPEGLTVEWLSEALRANVANFTTTTLGTGTGFTGQIARLSLQYAGRPRDLPSTLIAKFPPIDRQARQALNSHQIYEKEACFYRHLANSVSFRTPHPFYVDVNVDTADSILLLEDLAFAKPFNLVEGLSTGELECAVQALARFHASWWESPKLQEYAWLKAFDWNADFYQQRYNQTYRAFLDQTRGEVPVGLADLVERLRPHIAAIWRELAQPPITFLHGDFHPSNLFMTANPGELAVVDWQVCSKGRGTRDLAYFITTAVPVETRRAIDMDLIGGYHAELAANGVENYSLQQCSRDFRFALLDMTAFMVTIILLLDFTGSEDARTMRSLMLERFSNAILDHRAGDLLPKIATR